jgi:hypothetical protein
MLRVEKANAEVADEARAGQELQTARMRLNVRVEARTFEG